MKRTGNLYQKVMDKENIRKAILRASEHKRHQANVKKVLENIDDHIDKIHEMLRDHTFENSKYRVATIYEPLSKKTREIYKPSFFPDQVVHWCIMLQLQPLIMKGMDPHNCGNIPERGERHIREYLRRIIKTDRRNTKYYLKYDVHHFYPNIDHDILMVKLEKRIKDDELLEILWKIIKVTDKGLPIGTYTSQWLANYYLRDLDQFTREKLGATYMMRYVDDILILGPNKRALKKMQSAIGQFLAGEGLAVKPNWVIRDLDKQPIDFVGYQFLRNGKVLIRKRIWKNARRLMLRIIHHGLGIVRARRFMSYYGYILNSDSYRIKQKYLKPLKVKTIRQCIVKGGNYENIYKHIESQTTRSHSG